MLYILFYYYFFPLSINNDDIIILTLFPNVHPDTTYGYEYKLNTPIDFHSKQIFGDSDQRNIGVYIINFILKCSANYYLPERLEIKSRYVRDTVYGIRVEL